jgi:lipoprotein-anchoring transpeptidase ErfK/SrfK
VKWKNPWWYPPNSPWAAGEKPIPPGPGNPLGTRWMGISSPGVGIHGTPDAASIGYSASHGCIRMRIPDAEWLFDHVEVGTPVFIVSA